MVALSPAATLERGYAVVQRLAADGATPVVVRGPDEVVPGDALRLRLARGDAGGDSRRVA